MDDPVFPATLYRHKSAAFQRSWFRLLVYSKRYKHYANASQYHVPSCTKLPRSGSPNICILYLSTQTFSWLIGIFVTRSRGTGCNAALEKWYHLILYTSSSKRCCQPYEVLQRNSNICDGYAKVVFTTISCLLVPSAYSFTYTEDHICYRRFCESKEQGGEYE
jgi:hypothetical protein